MATALSDFRVRRWGRRHSVEHLALTASAIDPDGTPTSNDGGFWLWMEAEGLADVGALAGVASVVLEDVGEVVGPFLVDPPSVELESLVFIVLSETDTCLLHEAHQCEAKKACCNDEEHSGAISVLEPQDSDDKHDSEKKSGTNATAQSCEDATVQEASTAPQALKIDLEAGSCVVLIGYRV